MSKLSLNQYSGCRGHRIAIIGTGVAGLASAYHLQDRLADKGISLTLFEQASKIGGHAETIFVNEGELSIPIDIGFMVFNTITYPYYSDFLEKLGIENVPTSMSLSVTDWHKRFFYNSLSITRGFFPRLRDWFDIRRYELLLEIKKFHSRSLTALANDKLADMTLSEYLATQRICKFAKNYYVKPMTGAIWSAQTSLMDDFPAEMLINFLYNHGMLGYHTQFIWRTIKGGSFQYTEKLKQLFKDQIKTNTKIIKLKETAEGIVVISERGEEGLFKGVIVATHADDALKLVASAPSQAKEREALALFDYQTNDVYLHSSPLFMPPLKKIWSSWNILLHETKAAYRNLEKNIAKLPSPYNHSSWYSPNPLRPSNSFHYYINKLQPLVSYGAKEDYFVSLNPPIIPSKTHYKTRYKHLRLTVRSKQAQKILNAPHRTNKFLHYAGSYLGYGFHEDGFVAGRRAALRLSEVLAGELSMA
ncbi:hypothetical protein COTS27_01330 [Spirochaetota bacterium]|nr:hypothetical protein COTS27_01330 [Spirochaetota bacterium]